MHEALPMLAKAIAAPAAISLAVALLLCRFANEPWRRYAAAIAFATGFCAAFGIIRPWGELLPSRHWQWTFYIALAAAVLGPISAAPRLHWVERLLLLAFSAVVASWLLVPTWESLQPPRAVWLTLLASYFVLIAAAMEPLASFLPARHLFAWLTVSAGATAVLVTAAISLTYGQLAGASAAALLGCSLAVWRSAEADNLRALVPAYAAIVGGWAFVGCIDPPQSIWGLLLAPAAPLALWCFARGPLAKLTGFGAIAAQAGAVAAILGIAAWLALA